MKALSGCTRFPRDSSSWDKPSRYRSGSRTLRQVTQPSSFSNSLMSTTTGVKPRSSRSSAVRGADAEISTRSPPSGTT